KWLTSLVTSALGRILMFEDPERARVLFEESLTLANEIGHLWLIARALESLAVALVGMDRAELAVALMGSAHALRETIGARSHVEQSRIARAAAAAREQLGATRFDAAWHRGSAMTVGEAVALALGRPMPARERPPSRPGGLTRRETEIAQRIATGQTNRQIASALGISERTVDTHVQNMLNRLGLDRRTQIAAWATANLITGSSTPSSTQAR
ncbi:MAG: LuxR C-terminal-related transcriptional regulator, partial [Armatimonadota bacterium]|nr:LuxR C-terminal-related transcriptional regulator [Armatimonadota bacterium]